MSIRKLYSVVLAGALALSCASPLLARDHDDKCDQRIRKAEHNLDDAVRKHGEHSRQAEQKRRQLDEAREKCGRKDHDHDHDHDR